MTNTDTQAIARTAAFQRLKETLLVTDYPRISTPPVLEESSDSATKALQGLASLFAEAADQHGWTHIHGEGMAHLLNLLCDDINASVPEELS